MIKTLSILIILFVSKIIFCQNIIIPIEDGRYILDHDLHLIVCNKNFSNYIISETTDSIKIEINNTSYHFLNIPNKFEYGKKYNLINNDKEYFFYFTKLPLININTSNVILDDPKILADLIITDSTNSLAIESNCGIEYRGGFSQSYPKKSYKIELLLDTLGSSSIKIPLLNMRSDDDWILLSLYNEPLRLRNTFNHKLWIDMHTPYYKYKEINAKSGINTQYVELAINNEYLGVYALCEQVDKKQLKIKKYKSSIRGELYKGVSWGASTFSSLPSFDNNKRSWSGFEIKYPKEDDITEWENIYDFVDFVINSSNNNFEEQITDKFSLNNLMDYFIFLNLINAVDNTGKNIFIAKYKENEPYFYVPWDLDGTLGVNWNGDLENNTTEILKNGLFNRVLNSNDSLFNKLASKRWFELRKNTLEFNNLINRINQSYNFLHRNGIYEREELKWGTESVNLSNIEYTHEWLKNRIKFLDIYFNTLIFNTIEKYIVFPNPINSTFRINYPNDQNNYNIYDTNGKLLQKGILLKKEKINIENFSKGIYLIEIIDSETKLSTHLKIIKK